MASDIDKRRQEIKEKILRKSRAKTNIYIGAVLIIVVFAFLIFSSLNYGEQSVGGGGNSQTINDASGEGVNNDNLSIKTEAQEQEGKKTEASETKTELKTPDTKEFNASELVKISLVDDSQSAFWSNLRPTSVYFEDSPDCVSGRDCLKVEIFRERDIWPFADKVFDELQDWSDVKFISFWFKGNNTGLVFDVYIFFDKKWNNWVCLRFQDVYNGWVRFVFSTEKNIIKNGDVDWSKVWRIRIVNNNKSYTGVFYFDDFALWIPKETYKVELNETKEEETRIYGMKDTIVKGDLAVTLNRWYPVYTVKSYAGRNVIEMSYSRVDITVKNLGDKEIYLSYTPYKPVLVDDSGNVYEFIDVKVKRKDGLVVEHPDQLKLGVLYPGTSRSGAIFFYPTVTPNTDKVRLVLYLNKEKFEFVWDWGRLS